MNIQPVSQNAQLPHNNSVSQSSSENSVIQIPVSELPANCDCGVRIEIPDSILNMQSGNGENVALLSMLRNDGVLTTMENLVSPFLDDGSKSKKVLDTFGLFNVTQMALEIPSSIPGLSGKYGVQLNIVKPDIHPASGNYYLQVFPLHDEIGINFRNLPGPIQNLLTTVSGENGVQTSTDKVPWFGLTSQIVRNHGVELPIVKTPEGWKLVGETPFTPGGAKANYTEEWVIRPTELDLKYGSSPLQSTLGLEFGAHFKWDLDNPNIKYAILTNAASNAVGAAGGGLVSHLTGFDPMLGPHIGAMAGQALGHAMQYSVSALKPDTILWWAGSTLGLADLNKAEFSEARFTDYPRVWWHACEGAMFPKQSDIERSLGLDLVAMEEGRSLERAGRTGNDEVRIEVEESSSTPPLPDYVDILDILQETRV
ncbi:hypothetical protein OP554_003950 [Salmonella enterica]|nr:hypothetical protein [Salmonella enterica]ECE6505140.1 hypothetical protein [Salmonella enterica subsp. salamae]EHF0525792.1 NADPH-dependent L-lysine N(6)-monooxygenase MbtG [Salmonella enterica]EKC6528452.1 hypothetical protein [Salmonella enterica]ELL0230483.1 hypothetical protein [Salmonella enterica]